MGSILSGSMPQAISLEVEVFDLDAGGGFTTIELYGPGKELLDAVDCEGSETCFTEFTMDTRVQGYAVVKASQADGDWLTAAPIWVEPE